MASPSFRTVDGGKNEKTAEEKAAEAATAEHAAAEARAAGVARLRHYVQHLSPDELLEDPPAQKWILFPYFPAGEVSVFSGPGGSSKTTFLVYLAACRALGRCLFGHPDLKPSEGETVIVTTEDRTVHYRRKLAALRVAMGDEFGLDAAKQVARSIHFVDLAGIPFRMVGSDHGNFFPTLDSEYLAALIHEDFPAADFVIMETVSRLAGGVETNDSLSILVESAQGVGRGTGAGVVLVAHVSQDAATSGATHQHTSRGGTALPDNARSAVVLTRINKNNRKELLPNAELSEVDYKRLLVLACPKPNMAEQPNPVFLERVRNAQGPVLQLAAPRQKNTDRTVTSGKVLDLIRQLAAQGEPTTERQLERKHAADLGCTGREALAVAKDLIDEGVIVKGAKKLKGGGSPLLPTEP